MSDTKSYQRMLMDRNSGAYVLLTFLGWCCFVGALIYIVESDNKIIMKMEQEIPQLQAEHQDRKLGTYLLAFLGSCFFAGALLCMVQGNDEIIMKMTQEITQLQAQLLKK